MHCKTQDFSKPSTFFGVQAVIFSQLFIDCEALAKQGDNALGSIRLSVHLSIYLSACAQTQFVINRKVSR